MKESILDKEVQSATYEHDLGSAKGKGFHKQVINIILFMLRV